MQRSLRVLFVLLLACAVPLAAPAFAQQQISGTVTDAQTGESLPGASVSVPGTSTGAATDVNGMYEVTVGAEADSLRFSFVGFESQTVAIAGRTTIDVALSPATQQLDDVVVIGYGSVQQRDVTGTVTKVESADFNAAVSAGPEQLIAGKISGVQVSQPNGAPGSGSIVQIRGATSVNASNAPLYVIDGVPIDNEGNTASRNPLNFLNKNDIASVTVLKDASATAIYGSRGANGVILIETKGGPDSGARVEYSGSVAASTVANQIDVLNASEFRQVVESNAPAVLPRLGDTSTDWQEATQRTGITQEHAISFSRGYEDSDLRASLGYFDQEGIIESSSTQRISAAVNYNQRLLDDALSLTANFRGAQTRDDFEPGGVVGNAASFDPTQPIRDVTSPFGGFYEWQDNDLAENNPVAEYILESNEGVNYRTLGNVEASYELPYVEGLSARVIAGFDVTTGEREFFAPSNLRSQSEGEAPNGTVTRANLSRVNQLLDAYLNYDKDVSSISSSFDVTAGYSYQDFSEEYPEFTAQDFSSDVFGPNSTELAETFETFVTEIPNRLISVFGRLNYTFNDKYLLTATVRRDGSSRFGPANRWGTFPSAALAWRAHQESFVEEYAPFVSTLKMRVSWGVTGNQDIGDFLYQPLYAPGGPQAQAQFGNRFVNTIRPNAADETIKWEETTTINAGFDFGFLSDRITGSFEYYRSDTDDLLFTVPVAAGANLSNEVLSNIGEMRNQGFEFAVRSVAVDRGDFTYTAQFNASTNRNELVSIDTGAEGILEIETGGISGAVGNTIQVLREGEALNSFLVFQHIRDENGNPLVDGVDHNGDGSINDLDLYRDINDDGQINQADRIIDGNPRPDYILGHTSQFQYRNFDLSFTMRAHLGQQVYNNLASNFGHGSRLTTQVPSNLHRSFLDNGFNGAQLFSDVYVEDASFLRMDNITFGYRLPALAGVQAIRVFGSVSNAFVITGYSGPDPEVFSGDGSVTGGGIGIDNNLYPRSRTFTGGINVTL
jgi:TonB-dependent starch-binding outer membrane protein SusC